VPAVPSAPHPFPRLRWLGLAWLAVYVPSYAIAYGWLNFLFLCNLGVMITAAALLAGSRLLLSSQAIAAPVIGLAWALDAGTKVLTGDFLYGATAYMWDSQYPLFTRLLSLYHLAWPLLLLWLVARHGYDRRGWPLQTAIAGCAMVAARLISVPEKNVNFAFRDPFFDASWGAAPLHVAAMLLGLAGIAYGLTHWLLARRFDGATR
jgi:hypothetical protein